MSLGELVWAAIITGFLTALLAMFFIGVPLHRFLQRQGWHSFRVYALAGFLGGAFARLALIAALWLHIVRQIKGAPFRIVMDRTIEVWTDPIVMLDAAIIGMLAFGTLWLLVRPDRNRRAAA
jgi:hypothetical protein